MQNATSLKDLKLNKTESSRLQKIADIPANKFENILLEAEVETKKITNNMLVNIAKEANKDNRINQEKKDRIIHGTDNRGEKHGMDKLTKKEVLEIKILGKSGKWRKTEKGGDYKKIAKKYNISSSTVGDIIAKRTWKWL